MQRPRSSPLLAAIELLEERNQPGGVLDGYVSATRHILDHEVVGRGPDLRAYGRSLGNWRVMRQRSRPGRLAAAGNISLGFCLFGSRSLGGRWRYPRDRRGCGDDGGQ